MFWTVTVAPVAPPLAKPKVPVVVAFTPSVGVAVKAGVAPARICPAAPVIEIAPVVELIERGAEAVETSVPLVLGSVSVGVPAAACAVMVAVPLVAPPRARAPVADVALPTVSVLLANTKFALSCNTLPVSYINCPAAPPLVGVVPGVKVTIVTGDAQDITPPAVDTRAYPLPPGAAVGSVYVTAAEALPA